MSVIQPQPYELYKSGTRIFVSESLYEHEKCNVLLGIMSDARSVETLLCYTYVLLPIVLVKGFKFVFEMFSFVFQTDYYFKI